MSRQNAGNKMDHNRAMTMTMTTASTSTTTTAASSSSSSMVRSVIMMIFVLQLLTAGQAVVVVEAAFVVGPRSPPLLLLSSSSLSSTCLNLQRQGGGCNLVSVVRRAAALALSQQQQDPENDVFAAATTTIVGKSNDEDEEDNVSWKTGFDNKNTEYLSLTLKQHKPLGCTVEESLSTSTTSTTTTKQNNKKTATAALVHYVFVTKVVEGGHAAMAGILPGDVIIGVTNMFGQETENVAGLGINKVKSLVAARPKNEPLHLRIARGTSVVQEHEVALAELCSNGAANDVEIENCVLEYLQSGYDINSVQESGLDAAQQPQQEECDPELSDEDCLLDQMYSMWADDMSVKNGKTEPSSSSSLDDNTPKKQKVKPWSSRSSPSGTWVRDPKTGEMRNIDA